MLNRREILLSAAAALLMGCSNVAKPIDLTKTVAFESLIRQIKHDVGTYVFNHQMDKAEAGDKACGGQVRFQLSSVKLTVTARVDDSVDASGGLKIPLNMITIDANAAASRMAANLITTSITILPLTAGKDAVNGIKVARERITAPPPPSPDFEGTPITSVLSKFRFDMEQTADTPPCFNFGDGKQNENLVKWAFTITRSASGGGKLSFALFPIGAEGNQNSVYAHTIEAKVIAIVESLD